jgi:hypothetical protein
LCAQGGATTQLSGQRFDGAQRRQADVMFHSFDVVVNDTIIQAKKFKEVCQ